MNNGIISADYFPEAAENCGNVSIGIDDEEVLDYRISKMDEVFPIYFQHAVSALKKLMKESNLPKEKLVMWN